VTVGDLCAVQIQQFPLKIWARAQEHVDELRREFALIAVELADTTAPAPDVPRRLLDLIERLTTQFGNATSDSDAVRDAAYARGDESVDLTLHVPAIAREASIELGAMLDECDDYCRAGDNLLTLETPPEALAFRRWYLDEIVRQISGEAPTPWPQSSHARSLAATS
jgi:hypothetical protein